MFRKASWGIDISKTAVRAVLLVPSQLGAEVKDYDYFPLPIGPDVDEDSRTFAIREALTEFMAKRKLGADPVCISIPGQMMLNRFLSLPPVQEKRIPEIVQYEARQLIPFPLEDIVWDYQLIGAEKGVVEREAALFAVKEDVVRSVLMGPEEINLPVDMMQVNPLAAYNFIRFDRDPQESVAILDMGSSTTDLIIMDGDRFWLRNLSIAGDDMTEAFQEKFGMTFEEAEELKRRAGESKQADKILDVMRPVLRDLVGEVQRSMGFYKSQSTGTIFSKIILVGDAAGQIGLKEFLAKNLEYDVEVIDSLERISIAPNLAGGEFETNPKSFGVALGLALQGIGEATIGINLLPKDVAFARQLVRKRPFIISTVVLLAAALGLSLASAGLKLKETEKGKKAIDDFVTYVEAQSGQYFAATSEVDPKRAELKKLAILGYRRLPWAKMLTDITTAAKAEQVWLTALNTEMRVRIKGEEEEDRGMGGMPGMGFGPGGMPGMGFDSRGPGGFGPGGRVMFDRKEKAEEVEVIDWSEMEGMVHFTLEGATEEVEKGSKYILREIKEPLEQIPGFINVALVKTSRDEIMVPTFTAEEEEGEDDSEKTRPRAGMAPRFDDMGDHPTRRAATIGEESEIEEPKKIIRFSIEWDYLLPGTELETKEEEEDSEEVVDEDEAVEEAEEPAAGPGVPAGPGGPGGPQ